MTLELAMYFLSGVLFVVCCLIGVIWSDNKSKLQEHARQIEMKANSERLVELESRMISDMKAADSRWERLFDKQDEKHARDNETIRNDFREQLVQIREQVRQTEANILAQMKMLFEKNKE